MTLKIQFRGIFTPVYPTTEGVRQLTLRNLTEQALKQLDKGALLEFIAQWLILSNKYH